MKNMMEIATKTTLFVLTVGVIFTACKKDDPVPDNEVELITSVILTFTDTSNVANVISASFKDPDGVGGNAPTVFDDIDLAAGTTYHCSIGLLDESKSPAVDIGEEVEEEGADHQFYFTVDAADVVIKYDDADANGLAIGLQSIWDAGAASNGHVTVILKHKPGIKADNDPVTVGDTDVEVKFHLNIN